MSVRTIARYVAGVYENHPRVRFQEADNRVLVWVEGETDASTLAALMRLPIILERSEGIKVGVQVTRDTGGLDTTKAVELVQWGDA